MPENPFWMRVNTLWARFDSILQTLHTDPGYHDAARLLTLAGHEGAGLTSRRLNVLTRQTGFVSCNVRWFSESRTLLPHLARSCRLECMDGRDPFHLDAEDRKRRFIQLRVCRHLTTKGQRLEMMDVISRKEKLCGSWSSR